MADDLQQPEDGFSEPFQTVSNLQKELERLTAQQNEARRTAAFGGMTPDEAKEYEIRRMKVSQLTERLLQQETIR